MAKTTAKNRFDDPNFSDLLPTLHQFSSYTCGRPALDWKQTK